VLAIDAMFLRAEALRRRGRAEEVPALYETILDLDPRNDAAVDFLAGAYAYDLLPGAADPAGKLDWWVAADDLVERGLRARPGSIRLLFASFLLLVEVPERAGIVEAVERRVPARERLALERLMGAVRAAPTLPKGERTHLVYAAGYVPFVAARALAGGGPPEDVERALAAGDEALRLRPWDLSQVWASPDGKTRLDEALAAGLAAVRAARDALRGGSRAAAREAIGRYRSVAGLTPTADLLEDLLGR
jgi:hypothetical protein